MGLFGLSKAEKEAAVMWPQWAKIVQESANLVNTTENPETFFGRYDTMVEHLENLVSIEKIVKPKGKKPSEQLREILAQRELTVNAFIDRAWKRVKEDAAAKFTGKGERATYERFFTVMARYYDRMNPASIQKVEALKASAPQ